MKTVKIKVFEFNELSEQSKQKAIEKTSTINVDYDWWGSIYEDAANIGLKLNSFDIDRNNHATGEFIQDADDCANRILSEHGDICDTYALAKEYLSDYDNLIEKYSDVKDEDWIAGGNESEFDQDADELADEFLKSLLREYASILQKQYEYLMSDEAIIETIEANGYEFTEDGELFN